jgi:hypothetical protein
MLYKSSLQFAAFCYHLQMNGSASDAPKEDMTLNCWVLHPVACVSTDTLIKTTVRNKCFSCSIYCGRFKYIFVYILPEDGQRSGPKHVVSSAQ